MNTQNITPQATSTATDPVTQLIGAHRAATARVTLTAPDTDYLAHVPRRTATDRRVDRRRDARAWRAEVADHMALYR